MTTPLPCGCVRGEFVCPTAERLWRAAFNASDDAEYAYLRELYEAHFYQPATAPAREQEMPHV